MTISRPCYCTREAVKRALDYAETARNDGQVDRAIEAASDGIEGLLHRRFYPQIATRSFDWPNFSYARPWRLWLDSNEVISVTTLASGGVTIPPDSYFLRRSDDLDEPPYNLLEINLNSAAAFGGGTTPQRDISITGLFGYGNDEAQAGTLAGNINANALGVDVNDSSRVGVGDVIRIDTERMLVTGRTMLDTGQNLGGDLASSNAATLVPVTTGSAYSADEVILIDGERMLVIDVAGNNLVVKRAWDGSVLAAHTAGADIYASRALLVERGALGTVAASHTATTAVARHAVPGLIRDLAVAEALGQLLGETSGYARRGGSASASNPTSASGSRSNQDEIGIGLDAVRNRAHIAYGRRARTRAV